KKKEEKKDTEKEVSGAFKKMGEAMKKKKEEKKNGGEKEAFTPPSKPGIPGIPGGGLFAHVKGGLMKNLRTIEESSIRKPSAISFASNLNKEKMDDGMRARVPPPSHKI
ncbi:hypothetical protein LSTR_LSTR008484, partial [Laodelphax striatellus]